MISRLAQRTSVLMPRQDPASGDGSALRGPRAYWRVAGSQVLSVALPNTYWDNLGLKTLSQTRQRLNQTA